MAVGVDCWIASAAALGLEIATTPWATLPPCGSSTARAAGPQRPKPASAVLVRSAKVNRLCVMTIETSRTSTGADTWSSEPQRADHGEAVRVGQAIVAEPPPEFERDRRLRQREAERAREPQADPDG